MFLATLRRALIAASILAAASGTVTPARAAANFWLTPLPRSLSNNLISPSVFMPSPKGAA